LRSIGDVRAQTRPSSSEHDEGLSDIAFDSLLLNSDNIESDCLGEGSALANGDDITNLGSAESRTAVGGEVVMSLLEPVVLLDVVEVISSQDDGSGHLGRKNDTLEDGATDGHVGGEGALVVDVLALDGSLRGLEAYKTISANTPYLP
jgi:hypothetical protein